MNERELEIPLHDGKVIRGKLAGEWNWPLIIFVHGLTAHKEEVLPYTAARFFAQQGYSFLRFNLYDGYEDTRRMFECDLFTHAADVNAVTCFAKESGVDRIYLAGHSLGAYSLAMADKQWLDGLMLWEPSHPTHPPNTTQSYPYIEQLNGYFCNWSVGTILSAPYVQSIEQFHLTNYLRGWITPTLIACKGDSRAIAAADGYEAILQDYTEVHRSPNLEGADHNFTTDMWRDLLFTRSLSWLQAH